MPFGDKQEHESYGVIGISHVSCGCEPLFGSSIKHDRIIRLRIKRAVVERDLHKEWYFDRERIVVVDLSAAQFAEFVTTPNIGVGVPCTIRYADGKLMENPPYRGQNEIFNQELNDKFKKAMSDADSLIEDAEEMLSTKGSMKVGDKKILHSKIKMFVQHIKSNLPFLHKQFARSMDKTVSVAKAEIEGFYTSTIMKLGVKSLSEEHKPDKPMIE